MLIFTPSSIKFSLLNGIKVNRFSCILMPYTSLPTINWKFKFKLLMDSQTRERRGLQAFRIGKGCKFPFSNYHQQTQNIYWYKSDIFFKDPVVFETLYIIHDKYVIASKTLTKKNCLENIKLITQCSNYKR